MNPEGMAAWYYQGDGLKLWEEVYAAFNLVPRPATGSAPQMAGWFRKRINTIGDFKGLKMRIPNLGGKVYARAGATTGEWARTLREVNLEIDRIFMEEYPEEYDRRVAGL